MSMSRQGDFFQLLKSTGHNFGTYSKSLDTFSHKTGLPLTTGTTVLAVKYSEGVIVAGDRRATAGNMVMYDRTDKVIDIDRYTIMAIAGVPATAFEMARILEHSFKYYRRSQLQDLSFEGKLRALSNLLKENVPAALAGTGAVAPIFAGYDTEREATKIYFYDILGAEFEGVEHAMSGSGSSTIKGILHYINRWGGTPIKKFSEDEAVTLVLRLLTSAAEFDAATGGVDHNTGLYPLVKKITKEGISIIDDSDLKSIFEQRVLQNV